MSYLKSITDTSKLEAAMVDRYGSVPGESLYSRSMDSLMPLLAHHRSWCFKRGAFGERWEVKFDDTVVVTYGETLPIAVCKALLEIKK